MYIDWDVEFGVGFRVVVHSVRIVKPVVEAILMDPIFERNLIYPTVRING